MFFISENQPDQSHQCSILNMLIRRQQMLPVTGIVQDNILLRLWRVGFLANTLAEWQEG